MLYLLLLDEFRLLYVDAYYAGLSGRLFLPQTVICIRLHDIRLSVRRLLVCDDGLYDHGGSFHPRRVHGTDLCFRQYDYDRRNPFQAEEERAWAFTD